MTMGRREWSVYILRCVDGSLYTGIAKDPAARVAKHNAGTGAAYTRAHRPVALVWKEDGFHRPAALVREAAIKSLPRPRKEALIKGLSGPLPRRRKKKTSGLKGSK